MKTSFATFFTANKTAIMLASAVLVISAKSFSFVAQNSQQPGDAGLPEPMEQEEAYYGQMDNQQTYNGSGYGVNENANGQAYNTGGNYTAQYNNYAPAAITPSYNTGTGANTVDYTSGWEAQQRSQDAQHERFVDYIRDETKYNDAEGNSYKLSSGYDNNYVNTTNNTYLQTNDAGYDPNTYSTSAYTPVTASDYSASGAE